MSMNILILLTLLVILHAQRPNCNIIPGKQQSGVFVLPSETQVFPLQKYVEGYNLIFTATGGDNITYQLIQPFYNSDSQLIPDAVGHDFDLIDFSIETDENLAWIQRAAFLGSKSSDNNIFVLYGTLNEEQNVLFNNSVGIAPGGNTTCFNVITLSEDQLLIDCQEQDKAIDMLIMINETNNVVTTYPFSNSPLTTKRKTVALRQIGDREGLQGGRTYLLSAWIGSGMQDPSQRNNTKVEIYYLNKFVPQYVGRITAQNLSQPDLSISDISVDALGNVYVTDERGVVIQFRFDGNAVTLGSTWTFPNTKLYKTVVYTTQSLVSLVHVVAQNQIIEIDLEEFPSRTSYQLPQNIEQVVDFQTNGDLLVLQTESYYYVYRRYQTQVDTILSTFVSTNSRFIIAPRSPNLIFVNRFQSHSYVVSQGFLILRNSQEGANETIEVTALSASYDGASDVLCKFTFQVNAIKDTGIIYNKVPFPASSSFSSSPARESFNLEQYFLGSRIIYSFNSSSDAEINLLTHDLVTINSEDSSGSASWFRTYSYDESNYYKVTVSGGLLIIQDCNDNSDSINCKVIRKVSFDDKIAHFSFFRTAIDLKNTVPVLAYITEKNRKVVSFIQLNGNNNKDISPLAVDDLFNATDVDGNIKYLYVPIRDAKIIKVYKNNLNGSYSLAYTIESTDILSQDPDFVFFPAETMLSPININLLYVKNIDSIIILQITALQADYISSIPLPHLGYSYISSEVVVGVETMLVFISDNTTGVKDQIIEYGIYDSYQPITLRDIDLGDYVLARPVEVYTVPGSNILAAKTINQQTEYLTFIKMEQPSVGSVIFDYPTRGNKVSLTKALDSVVVETIPTQGVISTSIQAERLYDQPTLQVRGTLHGSNFKEVKSFTLWASTDYLEINATHDLQIYDVKSKVYPSPTKPDKINFQGDSNGEETVLELNADKYFTGPVAKYFIECEYCGNQIKLTDHVKQLNKQDQGKILAFHEFAQKSLIWAVGQSGIVVLDHDLNVKTTLNYNLNITYTVLGFAPYNSKFFVAIKNLDDKNYYLILVSTDDSRENINIESITQVTKDPEVVINNFQIMKTYGNRIFLLDNRLDATGAGNVFVFTTSTDDKGVFSVSHDATINYATFQTLGRINDFELIPQSDSATALFLATAGSEGLVYGSFATTKTPFVLDNPKSYSLANDTHFSDYQIDGSQYQQIQIISQKATGDSIDLQVLLTVSNGMHLQVQLVFNQTDSGFKFVNFLINSQLEKYGREQVLNWAQSLDQVTLIGYEGAGRGLKISLGHYVSNSDSQRQSMKGAVEYNISNYITNNFAALLFKHNSEYRVVVSVPGENNNQIVSYNLSQKVYLSYKIEEPGKFESIELIASNQYGNTIQSIPISFDGNSPGSKGLAWYIILVIVLGCLAIVALIVFLVIKYKKRKDISKDSLLSVSKPEEEDEQI